MPKIKSKDQVRIIGGKWRSRWLRFTGIDNLRPTPNRVRETLFNWLSPTIEDAVCLDCFAGSGALGFEALSRGAKYCVFIEKDSVVVQNLNENARLLQATNLEIIQATFPQLPQLSYQFDIVFLDPPFHQGLIASASAWLEESSLLSRNCLIYIEAEKELDPLRIPKHWQILKKKITGEVAYYLMKREANSG